MWTSAHIKRHIANLKPGDIFTTRNLLLYGTRNAVDQAIYMLVVKGRIERLARGVFMKPALKERVVTVSEIAKIKAEAFGKKIVSDGIDAAKKAKLREEGNAGPTYLVDGSSSTFRFGNVVIRFKRGSRRKVILGGGKGRESNKSIMEHREEGVKQKISDVSDRGIQSRGKE